VLLDPEVPTYVAGPMSNLPQFNVPAFLDARDKLEAKGYQVQLPADLDEPEIVASLMLSVDGAHDPSKTGGLTWGDCLALDVKLISDVVGGVAVIDGWENSRGARLETFVANLVGKPIVYAQSLEQVRFPELVEAWTGLNVARGAHGIFVNAV
jgi:hypothetical protein